MGSSGSGAGTAGGSAASTSRRRSSFRSASQSSSSRPFLTSRPVLLWTHDPPNFSTYDVVINPDVVASLGGVSDTTDLLELVLLDESNSHATPAATPTLPATPNGKKKSTTTIRHSFLFTASQALQDAECIERAGSKLQVSVARSLAGAYGFHNRCQVVLSKVSRDLHTISHVELYFRDQYVGRADMWRLGALLDDRCVHVGQKVTLAGCVRATIGRIFINEKKVMSGYVAPHTRTIFRSESAKYNLFLQMAREMWDFDEDGEQYFEKAISGFLPELVRRWSKVPTNHVVSVVLFARVHYDESELHMLEESSLPLRREEPHMSVNVGMGSAVSATATVTAPAPRWYIDYYKVIVDLESDCDWTKVLTTLKEEFYRFRHDILIVRRPVAGPAEAPWQEEQHADLLRKDRALLAGRVSASHEGNILEAINLALNPFDEHYIDRDLNRTGLDLVVVTAGTGHFNVDKRLLRLTTERLIDNGIGLDLVCLTRMPLHSVPLFHFQSQVPVAERPPPPPQPPPLATPQQTPLPAGPPTSPIVPTSARKGKRRGTVSSRSGAGAGNALSPPPDPLYFDPKRSSYSGAGLSSAASRTSSHHHHPHRLHHPHQHQHEQQQLQQLSSASAGLVDFYSIPHWIDCSFYNLQQDKPFRADRFVPRCKMHEIQMMGQMENNISDIIIPYLDYHTINSMIQSALPRPISLATTATSGSIAIGSGQSRYQKAMQQQRQQQRSSSQQPPSYSQQQRWQPQQSNSSATSDGFAAGASDLVGLGPRAQRRILRERFDRETFKDLEAAPPLHLLHRSSNLVLGGEGGRSGVAVMISPSHSLRQVPSGEGLNEKQQVATSQQGNASGLNAVSRSPVKSSRFSRQSSLIASPVLESHDEQATLPGADVLIGNQATWPRSRARPDILSRQPLSPTETKRRQQQQQQQLILSQQLYAPSSPEDPMSAAVPASGDTSRAGSRAASIRSVSTFNNRSLLGPRPLEPMGKAKASIGPSFATTNFDELDDDLAAEQIDSSPSSPSAAKAMTTATSADPHAASVGMSRESSRVTTTPSISSASATMSPTRSKSMYKLSANWIWNSLRGAHHTSSQGDSPNGGVEEVRGDVQRDASSKEDGLERSRIPTEGTRPGMERIDSSSAASRRIQELLKTSSGRMTPSSSTSSLLSPSKLHTPTRDLTGDEKGMLGGHAPISIPSDALGNDEVAVGSKAAATTGQRHGTNKEGSIATMDSGGTKGVIMDEEEAMMLREQDALERAWEEEEAKARYAQQAQVEKQTLVNPSNPRKSLETRSTSTQLMRWQHLFPRRLNRHVVKWRSMTSPACLPLTTLYLPTPVDLANQWQEYPYSISITSDSTSFLVKRRASTPPALAILREMASQRLAQGFQFIVPVPSTPSRSKLSARRGSRPMDEAAGEFRLREPSELFQPGSLASGNPIFLGMSNQIHRFAYDRSAGAIHVKRFVRRTEYDTSAINYSCCIWARNCPGYQTVDARFRYPDFGAYNWTYLDALVAGHAEDDSFIEGLRFWRTRFVVVPSEPSPPTMTGTSGEKLSDEEVRLLGMDRLADLFTRAKWKPKDPTSSSRQQRSSAAAAKAFTAPLRFIPTSLDPAMSVADADFMKQVMASHAEELGETRARRVGATSASSPSPSGSSLRSSRQSLFQAQGDLKQLAQDMYSSESSVKIKDRLWHRILYTDAFTGTEFVTWLCRRFDDVHSRDEATQWGARLMEAGLFEHVDHFHGFLDGHYFYRLRPAYVVKSTSSSSSPSSPAVNDDGEQEKKTPPRAGHANRRVQPTVVEMSRTMLIDVDPLRRSDRSEVAYLHHDLAHNPANGFNFQIHWLGTTARFIEDMVQSWTRTVERYGLRLIEAPIGQIADVAQHNPFQMPVHIPLALYPPVTATATMAPGQTQAQAHARIKYRFEYALLRKFGFILDQESSDQYQTHDIPTENVATPSPSNLSAARGRSPMATTTIRFTYRSRPNQFDLSQFVHRSGVAFVQVLKDGEGFLWLDNRLHLASAASSSNNNTSSASGGGGGGGGGSGNREEESGPGRAAGGAAAGSTEKSAGGNGHPKIGGGNGERGHRSMPSAEKLRRDFAAFTADVGALQDFYRSVLHEEKQQQQQQQGQARPS